MNNNRPSTPSHNKLNYILQEEKIQSKNTNKIKQEITRKSKKKISKEDAAKIIQRRFKIYMIKLKNDPKYEMSNLLKKKKLSILKNYNIIQDYSISNISLEQNSKKENSIVNSKIMSTTKEEEKKTANFGNIANKNNTEESRLTSLKEEIYLKPNSNNKDNCIKDYESFLSIDKPPFDRFKFKPDHFEEKENDKKIENLKKSLDKFTENYLTNNSKKRENSSISNSKIEDLDILDIITNKDQTSIIKNDVSETVNVYEKIFKEIKKEPSSQRSIINKHNQSKSEINVNYDNINSTNNKDKTQQDKEMKLDDLEEKIHTIDKNIDKISKKYQLTNEENEVDNKSSIVNFNKDNKEYESIKSKDKTDSDNENSKLLKKIEKGADNIDENKKKMVDRLTNMLEKEEIKSSIQCNLSNIKYENNPTLVNNDLKQKSINNQSRYRDTSYDNKLLKDATQDKIKNIHSILEENNYIQEKSNYRYMDILKHAEETDSKINITNTNNVANTAEVLNMVLELKESKKTIDIMKSVIEELKRDIKNKEDFHKKELAEKLSIQKFEFDNVIQRQNGLVESLLSEKKNYQLLLMN